MGLRKAAAVERHVVANVWSFMFTFTAQVIVTSIAWNHYTTTTTSLITPATPPIPQHHTTHISATATMAHSARLSPPTFDLETYSSNYDGPLQPLRLAHIAMHCPSLSHQALSIAIASAKAGKDVSLYRRLVIFASSLSLNDLATQDLEWTDRTEDANKRENARLEQELKGYKNNLIRESIRMGQEDLATHLLLTGGPAPQAASENEQPQSASNVGLNAAYGAFGKMRDFCTTPTHVASMTLRLLHTAIIQAVSALQSG